MAEAAPQAVYHLAALSSVSQSWADPAATFSVNAVGTLNLWRGTKAGHPTPCRVDLLLRGVWQGPTRRHAGGGGPTPGAGHALRRQ